MGDRLSTIDMGENLGGGLCAFWDGVPCNNAAGDEAYFCTKWHLDSSSRLATTNMGRKLGAVPPFWEGKLGPHLAQYILGRCLLHTKWHLDPSNRLGTIYMGRKLGALPPSLGGKRWVPI